MIDSTAVCRVLVVRKVKPAACALQGADAGRRPCRWQGRDRGQRPAKARRASRRCSTVESTIQVRGLRVRRVGGPSAAFALLPFDWARRCSFYLMTCLRQPSRRSSFPCGPRSVRCWSVLRGRHSQTEARVFIFRARDLSVMASPVTCRGRRNQPCIGPISPAPRRITRPWPCRRTARATHRRANQTQICIGCAPTFISSSIPTFIQRRNTAASGHAAGHGEAAPSQAKPQEQWGARMQSRVSKGASRSTAQPGLASALTPARTSRLHPPPHLPAAHLPGRQARS